MLIEVLWGEYIVFFFGEDCVIRGRKGKKSLFGVGEVC